MEKRALNISEAKKELNNMVKAYLYRDDQGRHLIPEKDRIPAILMGPPGIGKTDIVSQVALENDIGFCSYSLAHHTRNSLLGLPVIMTGDDGKSRYTEYTMSELIAMVEKEKNRGYDKGILFLDEFTSMSETIAAPMLSLIQQKRLGNYRLPQDWIIIMAGNPTEYNKTAKRLDMATTDRIRIIEVEAEAASYLEYARSVGVHEDVLDYLSTHKKALYFYDPENPQEVVTPRGWTNLGRTLKANEALGIETGFNTIRQFIRNDRIAAAFCEYMGRPENLPGRGEIMSVFADGRNGAFEECLFKLRSEESESRVDCIVGTICDIAVETAAELVVKYGYKRDRASRGLENIFELLREIAPRDEVTSRKYRQMLADKMSMNDILVKYVSYVDIEEYNTAMKDTYGVRY